MAAMIKLRLPVPIQDLASVQALPGLAGLALDLKFGLVPISPRDPMYVVRAAFVDDLHGRRERSPAILEVYGDIRISST